MTTSATLSPTPPETPARLKPKPTSLRQAWPAIFGLCLTMMVEMLDNSILNVALPTMAAIYTRPPRISSGSSARTPSPSAVY